MSKPTSGQLQSLEDRIRESVKMTYGFKTGARVAFGAALAVATLATAAAAQGWGPTRVGVTEARQASVQAVVQLPGTIEARTQAVVASSEAGLVAELRVREGDFVRRGVTLARLGRDTLERDLQAARGQLAEAQARLELAQRSSERSRELHESGVISRQQYDDAETEAGAWQGRVDQAAGLIARLEGQIERSVVRAPFTGIIVREFCEVGEWVAVGGEVVEMVDPRRLHVLVNVPERHFAGARKGAVARVSFESHPELDIEGTISAVIPQADPQTRTLPVKVEFENPEREIGVGMSATVAFPSGSARDTTVVPKDAIISQGSNRLVYVVTEGPPGEDGTPSRVATAVPIELGGGLGQWIEARGIEPGTPVITRGNERVAPGAPVIAEPIEYAEP